MSIPGLTAIFGVVNSLINQRAGGASVKVWTGTQAQYTALGSWDSATQYDITDASDVVDPWTYVKLASDFTTTSATAVDITGLSFTPVANASYEFEALLYCRTATATVGPRPGVAWPTGMTDGLVGIRISSSISAEVLQFGNINASVLAPVGGLPNTTQSWPGRINGDVIAGASPSGTVKMQMASETSGTTVTVKAGSWLRYRVR